MVPLGNITWQSSLRPSHLKGVRFSAPFDSVWMAAIMASSRALTPGRLACCAAAQKDPSKHAKTNQGPIDPPHRHQVAALTALPNLYDSAIRVNSTTASLTYLLVVLGAATLWGLPEAMLASIVSMLLLDYYFLPPVPSFGIDDPQNWVAWWPF